jgi:hypothetical protein
MEPLFTLRPAQSADVGAIFSILSEVACLIPIDLSTPTHVEAVKAQIDDCCGGGLSFIAVDEDGVVVGFQLAKKTHWLDDVYIHLTYAAVTATASGKGVFRRLIDAQKGHDLPLVAQVKPDNKSEMVARLTRYGFRLWSDPPPQSRALQFRLSLGP